MHASGAYPEGPIVCAVVISLLTAAGACVVLAKRRSHSWALVEAVVALGMVAMFSILANGAAVARGETRPLVVRIAEWPPLAQALICLAILCVPVAAYLLATHSMRRRLGPAAILAIVQLAATGAVPLANLIAGVSAADERPWYEPSASVTRLLYLLTWVQVVATAAWFVRRRCLSAVAIALLIGAVMAACAVAREARGVAFLNPLAVIALTDTVPRAELAPILAASVVAQLACPAAVLVAEKIGRRQLRSAAE